MAADTTHKARVGIPYRTRKEELTRNRSKYDKYFQAVRMAGAEPVEVPLSLTAEQLKKLEQTLDGIVLPGSPADVDPQLYRATRHPAAADADPDRERTDFALLEHAFAEHKPVLAICYGNQSMNVFLGGTLVQDIPSELRTEIQHPWSSRDKGAPEPFHTAKIEPGSRLRELADADEVRVNSSHHQSVLEPGRNLRVVARARDGVVEAVEWTGDSNWVTGVQWHPERMVETDPLAQRLFSGLVAAARKTPVKLSQP
ncbi:MAG: gamma-glutamyl-gamma-aminobutyrate hydrolase family protein [Candidatus Acidiferrales bacterium]